MARDELRTLLAAIDPDLRPGRFVFTVTAQPRPDVDPVAVVREDEGVTLVLSQPEADRLGLSYDYVAAMITLRVRSSLAAVGLTASVSATLARAGISCNVIAGYHHDHLFVPVDKGEQALHLLRDLARSHG